MQFSLHNVRVVKKDTKRSSVLLLNLVSFFTTRTLSEGIPSLMRFLVTPDLSAADLVHADLKKTTSQGRTSQVQECFQRQASAVRTAGP